MAGPTVARIAREFADNAEESRLALQGEAAVAPVIEAFAAMVRNMSPEDLVHGMGSGLCEADRARLTSEFPDAEWTRRRTNALISMLD